MEPLDLSYALLEIQFILALVALASAVIGPLITLYTIKRQLGAEVVTKSRHVWIETLRNEISEFLSITSRFAVHVNIGKSMDQEKIDSMMTKVHKIKLLLDTDNQLHLNLNTLVSGIGTLFLKSTIKPEEFDHLRNGVLGCTSKMIKEELDKIKNLR